MIRYYGRDEKSTTDFLSECETWLPKVICFPAKIPSFAWFCTTFRLFVAKERKRKKEDEEKEDEEKEEEEYEVKDARRDDDARKGRCCESKGLKDKGRTESVVFDIILNRRNKYCYSSLLEYSRNNKKRTQFIVQKVKKS